MNENDKNGLQSEWVNTTIHIIQGVKEIFFTLYINYPIHSLVLVLFKHAPNNYISMKFYDKMSKQLIT